MKLAAILGVKDEVELIAPCVAHLRAIGVDVIAVSDYGSTDGTLDVLSAERRHGDLTITEVTPDVVYDYESQSAHDTAQAHRTGADWVLFLDADEFFVPATGRLRDCAGLAGADVLSLDRFNVVTTATHLLMPVDLSPSTYDRLHLFTRRVDDFRTFLQQHPEVPFIAIRPGPKVIARRACVAAIGPGSHDVRSDGSVLRRAVSADLVVAHVPFTTRHRFERKVANIRTEVRTHPRLFEDNLAWHWRRWAEMTAPGELGAEFDRQVMTWDAVERQSAEGSIRSAADLFADRIEAATADPTGRAHRSVAIRRTDVPLRPVDPGIESPPAGS